MNWPGSSRPWVGSPGPVEGQVLGLACSGDQQRLHAHRRQAALRRELIQHPRVMIGRHHGLLIAGRINTHDRVPQRHHPEPGQPRVCRLRSPLGKPVRSLTDVSSMRWDTKLRQPHQEDVFTSGTDALRGVTSGWGHDNQTHQPCAVRSCHGPPRSSVLGLWGSAHAALGSLAVSRTTAEAQVALQRHFRHSDPCSSHIRSGCLRVAGLLFGVPITL